MTVPRPCGPQTVTGLLLIVAALFTMKVPPPIRRHAFRDAECALKPFHLWWCAVAVHDGLVYKKWRIWYDKK